MPNRIGSRTRRLMLEDTTEGERNGGKERERRETESEREKEIDR